MCALIRVNKKRKISYPADITTSDRALASIEIASNGVKIRLSNARVRKLYKNT